MNSLYVILFSNKILKVGSTSNLPSRIGTHRCYAKSMGFEIEAMWVTVKSVHDFKSAEKELIKQAGKHFNSTSNEFFNCKSIMDAVFFIDSIDFNFVRCESVRKSKKGEMMILEIGDYEGENGKIKQKYESDYEEKVLRKIRDFGEDGVSRGILINRLRNIKQVEIDKAIDSLIAKFKIEKRSTKKSVTYTASL